MKVQDVVNRKEDYLIDLTVIPDDTIVGAPPRIDGVRCKMYLPRKIADPILLVFHLTKDQYLVFDKTNLWKFSIEGEYDVPNHKTRFSAQNVYRASLSATYWSPDTIEALCVAEPIDLKREHFRSPDLSQPTPKTHGRFWLSNNRLLSPGQSIGHSFTGDVNVRTIWQVEFTLENGLSLKFSNRYRHLESNEETTSWSELVAEYQLHGKAQTFLEAVNCLTDLDDLLRLASLAARHRCVCLGLDLSTTEGYIVEYYRRDISRPAPMPDRGDELISKEHIAEFLQVTYRRLIDLMRHDLIRQAINYAIPREGRTVESSFITLYSALETIVLYFRRQQNLETVFSSSEDDLWKLLQKDLREFFRVHPVLRDDKTKRMRLYDNMTALRRVSFRTAFEECCRFYSVDVSDLWPVTGSKDGWSLSVVRNKLVHGEHFNAAQRGAVGAAKSHLQWTVERLLLAILGWDISKSSVDAGYLSRNNGDYIEWKSDQRILST